MMQSRVVIDNKFSRTFDRILTKRRLPSFFKIFFLFLSSMTNYIQFSLYGIELRFALYRYPLIYIWIYVCANCYFFFSSFFFIFFYFNETCCRTGIYVVLRSKIIFCNALSSSSCWTMKCKGKNKTHCIFFTIPTPNVQKPQSSIYTTKETNKE